PGLISIAIPLALLVMTNDLAVAMAALTRNEYKPNVNRAMAVSGLASMAAGLFGGHAANVGGMMSALCSSEEAGPKETRYRAAVVSSVLVLVFGLIGWKVI